jgi:hypothetical protein
LYAVLCVYSSACTRWRNWFLKQTNLTIFFYFKTKDICNIFAFVFFGHPSWRSSCIWRLHRKSKDSERGQDGWRRLSSNGLRELEPNKTTVNEHGPLSNTITIFPLRCTLPRKVFF